MSINLEATEKGSVENVSNAGSAMHEQVFSRLREALITGQLAPGRALSVRRLASEFDVSAMPAREAIRRLVAVGALEYTDTRRVMIARMSEEKLEEIKQARLALEPILANFALSAVEGQPKEKKKLIKQLEAVDNELDLAIRRGDVTAYSKLNSDFHFALYRSSQANVLLNLVESLWLQFGPFMRVVIGRLGTSCLVDDKHKDIIDAVSENDAEKLKNAVKEDILHGMHTISLDDATEDS